MVFLLPASPAHAAGATVTLSTITSGVETAATSGTVGSSLVITGQGFASNAPIAITSTVGTTTVTWFTSASANTCTGPNGAFASAYGGIGSQNSLYTTYSGLNCLTTTAIGNFKTTVTTPAMPGGAQTIVVTDGTNTVSTAFTVTPKISYATTSPTNNGFPTQSLGGSVITATGFGTSETITFASSAFTTASFVTSCTTGGSSTTGAGSCLTGSATFVVADTTAGAKSITATGGTSGLTASTTYTVNPWVSFYNSGTGGTSFSFVGQAPTSLLIEAHGLAAGTIAASSITIGGVATSHASVTVGSSGSFGGAGGQLVVSPTANVPFGLVSAVIGGVTFSYATGNIAAGTGTWGAPLISSIIGTGTSTGVAATDAASYKPGTVSTASKTSPAPAQSTIGIFGYGFVPGNAITVATPTGASFTAIRAPGNADANGAFYSTQTLGDTPWSATATPTTAASYTATVTEATSAPANILSPSFGITPWTDTTSGGILTYSSASTTGSLSGPLTASTTPTVDYTASLTAKVHGFGATDVVTLTIGGASFSTAGLTGFGTCTAVAGACTTVAGVVPDLGAGKQNVTAAGSVTGTSVKATGAVTYDPRIDSSGSGTALNIVAGAGGQTTILRSGLTYGAHGLTANTAYSIVWNAVGGSVVVGTFTSTATGGIPVPGKQITVPADISGIHIIDIQATSTLGTSAIYSNTLASDFSDSDTGLGATFTTQYGDMLFSEGTSLVASPTVANVGGSTVISGNGLAASTLYDLGISMAGIGTSSPATPSTCSLIGTNPAALPNTIVGSFTSTSGGNVPSAISIAITDMPAYAGGEQGTLYCVYAQTGPNFGTNVATGVAEFELQANLALNMTSAAIGHNVIASAHGLAASTAYNVLFNYQVSSGGIVSGSVVGAILTNSVGAGSATFTVSNIASGSYGIELQKIGSSGDAIANPPSIAVSTSTSSGSCTNQGTTCMTVSGTPSVQTVGAYKAIVASYTNNSNATQTAVVYAIVHNVAGQTVLISTATVSPAAGASAQAQLILFGLPSGTYSATLFATSTGGVAISGTTTVSVTL